MMFSPLNSCLSRLTPIFIRHMGVICLLTCALLSEVSVGQIIQMDISGLTAKGKAELANLHETRKYYEENLGPGKPLEFPVWARDEFMRGLNEGIQAIENATETP